MGAAPASGPAHAGLYPQTKFRAMPHAVSNQVFGSVAAPSRRCWQSYRGFWARVTVERC